MKRLSALSLFVALTLFLVFSFTIIPCAASTVSDVSSEIQEGNETETSSEIVLSIDVTERYTDGYTAEDTNNTPSVRKVVFIGIVCLLLLIGIIIIAVKSRDDGDV